nr:G protein-coupled receptor [Proales similis]
MDLQDELVSNASNCSVESNYLKLEAICYLFIMCPLAVLGLVLNLAILKVFSDKSFNTVTFKYLRLIAVSDFFICLVIVPYCLTAYTQPFNEFDLYGRHLYLAYVYIPGANLAINLSMFLNLLVTVERLISVGWPTHKNKLFKPSRYYMSCALVLLLAIGFNMANFFLYKVELCRSVIIPRSFTMEKWWSIYGYLKEAFTRILPIILLTLFNIALICIVKSSRKRMKESLSIKLNETPRGSTYFKFLCISRAPSEASDLPSRSLLKSQAAKRNRQENQLTWMTIFVAILYLATTIPMVFAYPGLLFSAEETQTRTYKMYAVAVNILELVQCALRFLIYFCFTTQFRHLFLAMIGFKRPSRSQQMESQATQARNQINL